MYKSEFYLPLKSFGIVSLSGLHPDQIKQSAKNVIQEQEKSSINTCLNAICKALGFKGGFADYTAEYQEKLLPFLENNGMNTQADLLTPRMPAYEELFKLLASRLSDRLFKSGKPLPQKVFTGYNYDFYSKYDDGIWYFQNVISCSENPFGFVSSLHPNVNFAKLFSLPPNPNLNLNHEPIWKKNLAVALENPDLIVKGQQHWPDRTLINVFLGQFMLDIFPSFNLIGDALVEPMLGDGWQTQIYFPKSMKPAKIREVIDKYDQLFKAFRDQIKRGEDGWVEIVPYNDKLIFLKGSEGEYDFTFMNLRDKLFEDGVFMPHLKNADTPKQQGSYHFQRWHYYEYAGWKERDEHEAEKYFYASGGETNTYPCVDEVYRRYQTYVGNYKPFAQYAGKSDGFKLVGINGVKYYVSDLVTIEDFRNFEKGNPDYFSYRRGDKLAPMNQDTPDMPVAVTWYDANAYAAEIQHKLNLPVRLLTVYEYKALIDSDPTLKSLQIEMNSIFSNWLRGEEDFHYEFKKDLHYFDSNGSEIEGKPPYMDGEAFQNLVYRYDSELKWVEHEAGIKFIVSDPFSEWLNNNKGRTAAVAINTNRFTAAHSFDPVERSSFIANSTGKYKYLKIGFRLCYLASN